MRNIGIGMRQILIVLTRTVLFLAYGAPPLSSLPHPPFATELGGAVCGVYRGLFDRFERIFGRSNRPDRSFLTCCTLAQIIFLENRSMRLRTLRVVAYVSKMSYTVT